MKKDTVANSDIRFLCKSDIKQETVIVMLSSYNGINFLAEQLESIRSQRGVNVILVVRDDGSTDGTQQMLRNYAKEVPIYVIYGKNIGYKESFKKLVQLVQVGIEESNLEELYFAFSDQDDVWMPTKLQRAVKAIFNSNQPSLYYCSLRMVDANLNFLAEKHYTRYIKTLGSALCMSSVAGCSMVFNQLLFSKYEYCLRHKPNNQSHDSYLYQLAYLLSGNLKYDDHPMLLFRRHGDNTSNAGTGLIRKFQSVVNVFRRPVGFGSAEAQNLIDAKTLLNANVSSDNNSLIMLLASQPKSPTTIVQILKSNQFRTGKLTIDIVMYLNLILNRY